jgi:hypothetical protein
MIFSILNSLPFGDQQSSTASPSGIPNVLLLPSIVCRPSFASCLLPSAFCYPLFVIRPPSPVLRRPPLYRIVWLTNPPLSDTLDL